LIFLGGGPVMASIARPTFQAPSEISPIARWWGTIDRPVFAMAAMLMTVGLVFSFASSGAATSRLGYENEYFFVIRQAMFVSVGASVIIGLSFLTPTAARRAAAAFYVLAVVLMVYILIFGHEAKGAQRWLRFGGFSLQPSEFLKPALVVVAAWLFSKRLENPLFPAARIALALYAIPVALLIMQPDIGQTGLLTLAFLTVFFIAGMPWVWIAGFFGAAVIGCGAIYVAFEHVQKRVNGFLNPETGETYQTDRALDAIASGDFLGRGPGEGSIKDFLPDAHTDFIYSVAAEEFGLMASVGLIALFGALVVRGLHIANRQGEAFPQLAATGLFTLIGYQSAINLAVNLNLMPAKGMTLPFISYGGSSILGSAITIGLALALTRKRPGQDLRAGKEQGWVGW
jgi:cell division protein FtsW